MKTRYSRLFSLLSLKSLCRVLWRGISHLPCFPSLYVFSIWKNFFIKENAPKTINNAGVYSLPPSLDETRVAIQRLQNSKAVVHDGLPSELFKVSGRVRKLAYLKKIVREQCAHRLILSWKTEIPWFAPTTGAYKVLMYCVNDWNAWQNHCLEVINAIWDLVTLHLIKSLIITSFQARLILQLKILSVQIISTN